MVDGEQDQGTFETAPHFEHDEDMVPAAGTLLGTAKDAWVACTQHFFSHASPFDELFEEPDINDCPHAFGQLLYEKKGVPVLVFGKPGGPTKRGTLHFIMFPSGKDVLKLRIESGTIDSKKAKNKAPKSKFVTWDSVVALYESVEIEDTICMLAADPSGRFGLRLTDQLWRFQIMGSPKQKEAVLDLLSFGKDGDKANFDDVAADNAVAFVQGRKPYLAGFAQIALPFVNRHGTSSASAFARFPALERIKTGIIVLIQEWTKIKGSLPSDDEKRLGKAMLFVT